jgi:hypothetical protein
MHFYQYGHLNKLVAPAGFEPTIIEGKHLYGRRSSPFKDTTIKICDDRRYVVTARTRHPLLLFFDHFWTFLDNYLYIFDKAEVQTVILRC